jgi:hypothetical protein
MTKAAETFITCDPEFISKRRSNGDILLVRLDDSEVYFTIDGISTDIWESLLAGKSIEKSEAELIKKHPKEGKEIQSLMKKFIKDLVKNKIINIKKK